MQLVKVEFEYGKKRKELVNESSPKIFSSILGAVILITSFLMLFYQSNLQLRLYWSVWTLSTLIVGIVWGFSSIWLIWLLSGTWMGNVLLLKMRKLWWRSFSCTIHIQTIKLDVDWIALWWVCCFHNTLIFDFSVMPLLVT